MQKNTNIKPRALTEEEILNRQNDVFDSFANYLCFCSECGYLDKSNMYLMRAESRVKKQLADKVKCPDCGKEAWILGYPEGTRTGFVKFDK